MAEQTPVESTPAEEITAVAQHVTWHGSVARAVVRARLFGETVAPASFGRYEWRERLGQGGMGTVAVAHDPVLGRDVALKLIEANRPQLQARVIREARANARVNHPNVVAIYDVGVAGDRVFIVMEMIRGETLRQWHERRRPGWRETLSCFLEIGAGLAAVHGAGLVHRDVKPENVVVGDDGRVVLIDFGIARALADGVTPWPPAPGLEDASSGSTEGTDAYVGTPAYMAPEQLGSGPIDARADQFAFCVALWELLWGQRPGGRAAVLGVAEGPWPPPRPATAKGTPRALHGILARGLGAEPEQRWPTLEALLVELRGVLRGRRRRLGLVGAGVGALAIGVLAIGTPASADTCEAEGANGAALWSAPQRSAAADGFAAIGGELESASWQRIDRALGTFARSWAREHEQSCRVEHVAASSPRARCLARVLASATAVAEAVPRVHLDGIPDLLDRAERLPDPSSCRRAEVLASSRPPVPASLRDAVEQAEARLAQGEHALAAGDFSSALAAIDEVAAADIDHEPLRLATDLLRARVYAELGPFDRARDGAIAVYEAAEAAGDPTLAGAAAVALAPLVAQRFGDAEAAEQWVRRAFAEARKTGDPIELESAERAMAIVAKAVGEPAQSLRLFEGVRARVAQRCDTPCQDMVEPEMEIARALDALGRADEATGHARTAVEVAVATAGEGHPLTAVAHQQLCIILDSNGEPRAAQPHCELALDGLRTLFGSEHPETAGAMLMLGTVRNSRGELESGRALLREAHDIFLRTSGPLSDGCITASVNLGASYIDAGEAAQAAPYFEVALRAVEQRGDFSPLDVATIHINAGMSLAFVDDAAARRHFELAIAAREAAGLPGESLVTVRSELGAVLVRQGELAPAREVLELALAAEPSYDTPRNQAIRRRDLALALREVDPARARRLAGDALRLAEAAGDDEDDLRFECRALVQRLIEPESRAGQSPGGPR
ncbi:MAG: serine/threonine protein kinase [Deltaproteobacteria bacterium]|nr:serine/threonine protein kinase [Deltaproteobacteria bacterium]MBK8718131.1 serine/threonine protein kinase [Deltaproteobacteria bacterium]MBP7288460.1 serine/threonine protein kinase [Nannocystaceae bacterium]